MAADVDKSFSGGTKGHDAELFYGSRVQRSFPIVFLALIERQVKANVFLSGLDFRSNF